VEDEFLFYLKNNVQDRLIASFDNTDLLLWGSRKNNDVQLLGVTINIGVRDLQTIDYMSDKRVAEAMTTGFLLSQMSHSAFFAIVYPFSGTGDFKVTSTDDPTNWSKSLIVEQAVMPKLIQQSFHTDFRAVGTAKPVNKTTSDWFHDWARVNLPLEYIRTNIDGLLSSDNGRLSIILETKRSFFAVDSWRPYKNDARNYFLQRLLATDAGLKFWTVYHVKGQVEDRTGISLFEIFDVFLDGRTDWIGYKRTEMKASDFLGKINAEAL
jgi:hypothetical protein